MSDLKPDAPVAAVIGDVVGSRSATDRAALHVRLRDLLDRVNAETRPLVPLRITVGDEYQGCFATVGEALAASFRLRLAALPDTDIRHGIGWGSVAVLAEEPRVEDGPGWWAAREAIDAVRSEASRSALRRVRTAYRRAAGADGPEPAAVNAALLCRDQVVGSLTTRSVELLRGLVAGRTQAEIAEEQRVSASAMSQRLRNDGLAVVLAADELLKEV
jgi:hypothetical protein